MTFNHNGSSCIGLAELIAFHNLDKDKRKQLVDNLTEFLSELDADVLSVDIDLYDKLFK